MAPPALPADETMFEWIAAERRRLADVIESLDSTQLATPSLCGDWTVSECAAHLTAGINLSWRSFGVEMLKARGSFDVANSAITRKLAGRGVAQTVADLRDQAEHRFTPPGAGPEAPLTDLIVHSQEMFRPLGIDHGFESERLAVPLTTAVSAQSKKLMGGPDTHGVRLVADDMEWELGSGPEVHGPGLSFALVLTGRQWALEDLDGEGLGRLTAGFGNAR